MKSKILLLFLILIALVLSDYAQTNQALDPKQNSSTLANGTQNSPPSGQSGQKPSVTLADLRVGSQYILYKEPSPALLTDAGEVKGGSQVEVVETKGEWVHVKQDAKEGWLPKWYVTPDKSNPVKDVQMDPLVLNKDLAGRLYPDGSKSVDLTKGQLLTPIKEWGNWYEVRIIVYDIPAVMWAWVPKDALSGINQVKPTEGFLREGTEMYPGWDFENIATSQPEKAAYLMNVLIIGERSGYFQISAGGGWTGWTKKENIVFKP